MIMLVKVLINFRVTSFKMPNWFRNINEREREREREILFLTQFNFCFMNVVRKILNGVVGSYIDSPD